MPLPTKRVSLCQQLVWRNSIETRKRNIPTSGNSLENYALPPSVPADHRA